MTISQTLDLTQRRQLCTRLNQSSMKETQLALCRITRSIYEHCQARMVRTDPARKQYRTIRIRYRSQTYHRQHRMILSNRDTGTRELRRTSPIRQPDGPSISETSPYVNNNYARSFSHHGITR